ncbi:MAG TPA: hypothetical protein VJ738_01815, partial [Steroidobacteraceae bacterium]|nr:hypothetical protein [Steroidobacteraceae bacterium]
TGEAPRGAMSGERKLSFQGDSSRPGCFKSHDESIKFARATREGLAERKKIVQKAFSYWLSHNESGYRSMNTKVALSALAAALLLTACAKNQSPSNEPAAAPPAQSSAPAAAPPSDNSGSMASPSNSATPPPADQNAAPANPPPANPPSGNPPPSNPPQ